MSTTKAQQPGQIDIHRLMAVMSEILSDKYDCKITLTARPKEAAEQG